MTAPSRAEPPVAMIAIAALLALAVIGAAFGVVMLFGREVSRVTVGIWRASTRHLPRRAR